MFFSSYNVRLFYSLNYRRIIRALQLSTGRLLLTKCAFFLTCRTESVAEKMLTNWFAFLLHKFLKVQLKLSHNLLLQVSMGYTLRMLLRWTMTLKYKHIHIPEFYHIWYNNHMIYDHDLVLESHCLCRWIHICFPHFFSVSSFLFSHLSH